MDHEWQRIWLYLSFIIFPYWIQVPFIKPDFSLVAIMSKFAMEHSKIFINIDIIQFPLCGHFSVLSLASNIPCREFDNYIHYFLRLVFQVDARQQYQLVGPGDPPWKLNLRSLISPYAEFSIL